VGEYQGEPNKKRPYDKEEDQTFSTHNVNLLTDVPAKLENYLRYTNLPTPGNIKMEVDIYQCIRTFVH